MAKRLTHHSQLLFLIASLICTATVACQGDEVFDIAAEATMSGSNNIAGKFRFERYRLDNAVYVYPEVEGLPTGLYPVRIRDSGDCAQAGAAPVLNPTADEVSFRAGDLANLLAGKVIPDYSDNGDLRGMNEGTRFSDTEVHGIRLSSDSLTETSSISFDSGLGNDAIGRIIVIHEAITTDIDSVIMTQSELDAITEEVGAPVACGVIKSLLPPPQ